MKADGAALLLRELRQVAVAGHAQHFQAFFLDRLRERADAEAGGVLGAEVFVDDDDRESGISWAILQKQRPLHCMNGSGHLVYLVGQCAAAVRSSAA